MDSLESNAALGRTEKILLEGGLVEALHLSAAHARMQRAGGTLPGNLVRMGLVAESQLLDSLSRGYELPTAGPDRLGAPQADALALLPFDYAYMHRLLPLRVGRQNGRAFFEVALADPSAAASLAALPALGKLQLRALLSGERAIEEAIERAYGRSGEDLPPLEAAIDAIRAPDEEEETLAGPQREEAGPMGELEILEDGGPPGNQPEEAGPGESELELDVEGLDQPTGPPQPQEPSEPPQAAAPTSKELLAVRVLIELLEEKGILTRQEFVSALRKMTEER